MQIWRPGAGWQQGKTGRYYPHEFIWSDFPGARVVAIVFKVAAWVVLAFGAYVTWLAVDNFHQHRVLIALATSAGTVLTAAAVAFFGYVLQLLVALHFDSQLHDATDAAARVERGELTPPGLQRLK